jgi:quercetin dioxygenase-like cupin family protein
MEPLVPHGIVTAALVSWLNAGTSSADRGAPDVPAIEATTQEKDQFMQAMTIGITKASTGLDGIVWNILGQTYVPKQVSENSFSWHATFPPGTFVPPHIHPTQEEFIYMFEGKLDCVLDGREYFATAGDLLRLPMGIPHGFFNKSDQPVKCLFWVTPARRLYDLFWAIHSMKEQKPDEVVALSAKHEVVFLPPPP